MGFSLGQAVMDLTANDKPMLGTLGALTGKLKGMFSGLSGLLGGIGIGLLAKDAMEAEEIEHRLKTALAATGQEVQKNTELLNRQASAMQNAAAINDEETKALMALAINYGATADQAGNLVRMAMGLAKAYGKDARSMLESVTKAQNGYTLGLRRALPDLYAITDETKLMNEVNNRAAQGWKQVMQEAETTSGSMKRAKYALTDITETLWGAFAPAVISAANWINQWAQFIGNWIGQNQGLAFGIMQTGAALGGLLIFGPKIIAMIRGIGSAMMFLAANPIGMIITAVGLILYAFYEWGLAGDSFSEKMQSLGSMIDGVFGWITPLFETFKAVAISVWESIRPPLEAFWNVFKGIFEKIWEWLGPKISAALKWFADFVSKSFIAIGFTVENFGLIWHLIWTKVKLALSVAWDYISGVAKIIAGAFVWLGESIWNIIQNIWTSIKNFGENIKNFAGAVWNWMKSGFTDWKFDWKPLGDGFKNTLAEFPKWAAITKSETTKELQIDADATSANLAKAAADYNKKISDSIANAKKPKMPSSGAENARPPGTELTAIDNKGGAGSDKSKMEFVGLEDFWKKTQESLLKGAGDDPATKAAQEGNDIAQQQLGVLQNINQSVKTPQPMTLA